MYLFPTRCITWTSSSGHVHEADSQGLTLTQKATYKHFLISVRPSSHYAKHPSLCVRASKCTVTPSHFKGTPFPDHAVKYVRAPATAGGARPPLALAFLQSRTCPARRARFLGLRYCQAIEPRVRGQGSGQQTSNRGLAAALLATSPHRRRVGRPRRAEPGERPCCL